MCVLETVEVSVCVYVSVGVGVCACTCVLDRAKRLIVYDMGQEVMGEWG